MNAIRSILMLAVCVLGLGIIFSKNTDQSIRKTCVCGIDWSV